MAFPCPACRALSITRQTVVCPRCRFVVRPNRPPESRAARDIFEALNKILNVTLLVTVLAAIVAFVTAKLVIDAIPMMERASVRKQEQQAVLLLRRLYELQHSYYDQNSAFAGDAQLLQPLGWQDPDRGAYSVRVSSAYRDGFCLEAEPVAGEEEETAPRPMSMNADGFLFQQNGCTGNVDMRRSGVDR
ncbi:MAG TPA: hypothetical protein VGB15_06700 [Longimicrobium sp.]|jgi:hypothetical protein